MGMKLELTVVVAVLRVVVSIIVIMYIELFITSYFDFILFTSNEVFFLISMLFTS